jgi:hypothetical protein
MTSDSNIDIERQKLSLESEAAAECLEYWREARVRQRTLAGNDSLVFRQSREAEVFNAEFRAFEREGMERRRAEWAEQDRWRAEMKEREEREEARRAPKEETA